MIYVDGPRCQAVGGVGVGASSGVDFLSSPELDNYLLEIVNIYSLGLSHLNLSTTLSCYIGRWPLFTSTLSLARGSSAQFHTQVRLLSNRGGPALPSTWALPPSDPSRKITSWAQVRLPWTRSTSSTK